MHRRRLFGLLASSAIGATFLQPTSWAEEACSPQAHQEWVGEALMRMQTITSGMTRKKLLTVFTTEGGLSTGLRRTFVSRDCPFFKVDVKFRAVGRPERDQDGRVTLIEGDDDVIVKISRPYLESGVMD